LQGEIKKKEKKRKHSDTVNKRKHKKTVLWSTQQPLHPQLLSADKSGKGLELDEGGKRHMGSRISHQG
jgi:hypothetical protein